MIRIDARFPTGNGVLMTAPDGTPMLDRDSRDSTGDRWYWHVRLRADTDTVARVRLARPGLLGRYGPAVRRDGRYEWSYTTPQQDGWFAVPVTASSDIRLCATLPYGLAELDAFRRRTTPDVTWRTLAASERHLPVPMLAAVASEAPHLLLLTARHHACEATASYVLEGAVNH